MTGATPSEPGAALDLDQDRWKARQVSIYSEVSRKSDVETLAADECFSRQCSSIDDEAAGAVDPSMLEAAVAAAVAECRFCVSVGDPQQDDCPLIAVSDEFEAMTGYCREEVLGKNCRILNMNCCLGHEDFSALRACCQCGESFTKVVLNRKKSGELFLNLIDLRGLVVAQDVRTGADLWFVVGIQADVTRLVQDEIPQDHMASLKEVASMIRAKLTEQLATFAVTGALRTSSAHQPPHGVGGTSDNNWWVIREPRYRPASESSLANGSPCTSRAGRRDGLEGNEAELVPRQASKLSRQESFAVTRSFGVEDVSMDSFVRQQSVLIDQHEIALVGDASIERAIIAAVEDCRFCVSIGDPRGEDYPLIAVSDEFEAMTGYSREEIVGKNCRILGRNCHLSDCDMRGLRTSCETGAPFTKTLLNRKKSGALFLNFLDLRGLTVARKPCGQELWFLVGIQADVTAVAKEDIPDDHLGYLHKVAATVRDKLKDQLSAMAVAGSISQQSCQARLWHPGVKARWKLGDQFASNSFGSLGSPSRH